MKRWLRWWVDFIFVQPTDGVERLGGEAAWRIVTAGDWSSGWVISGGAGNDISFELELIRRFQAKVHLFDPSPTGTATVSRLQPHSGLWFHAAGLAGQDGNLSFGRPEVATEGSYRPAAAGVSAVTFPCRSLSRWLREQKLDAVNLLKIDIEGFEYEVLPDVIAAGFRPHQIAVEFHHFMAGFSRLQTLRMVWLLQAEGYHIAAKHRQDYLFVRPSAARELVL